MLTIYFTNFLMAISTTIGMTLIPFLVTDSLGLSILVLGIVEGGSEFVSSVLRLANGILFDKIKNKRFIFAFPTTLAFAAKVLLLIPSSFFIILSMILERMANGAFASPRDAFIGEHARSRGLALGILSASKSFGCILGPLLVSGAAFWWGGIRELEYFLIALCCVLLLPTLVGSFFIDAKDDGEEHDFIADDFRSVLLQIGPLLGVVMVFFLGRFNDGLLMMSLKTHGYPEWFYLSTISIFNFTMMVLSPIIGRKIDQGQLKAMNSLSIGSLVGFGLCFYFLAPSTWVMAVLGLIFWGVQRTGTQIVFSAMIFNRVKPCQYGTAIGMFYVVSGFGTMISALVAGYLAKHGYFQWVFALSSLFGLAALLLSPLLVEFTPVRLSSRRLRSAELTERVYSLPSK